MAMQIPNSRCRVPKCENLMISIADYVSYLISRRTNPKNNAPNAITQKRALPVLCRLSRHPRRAPPRFFSEPDLGGNSGGHRCGVGGWLGKVLLYTGLWRNPPACKRGTHKFKGNLDHKNAGGTHGNLLAVTKVVQEDLSNRSPHGHGYVYSCSVASNVMSSISIWSQMEGSSSEAMICREGRRMQSVWVEMFGMYAVRGMVNVRAVLLLVVWVEMFGMHAVRGMVNVRAVLLLVGLLEWSVAKPGSLR